MFLGLIGILENPIHKITIVSVLFSAMITHGLMNSVQIRMFLFVKWHLMVISFTLLAPFLPAVWFLSTHFCKSYCCLNPNVLFRSIRWLFQIVFQGEIWCLFTVIFLGKVDFLILDTRWYSQLYNIYLIRVHKNSSPSNLCTMMLNYWL